ncbi:MAG: glycosyltransferase family 4 protein [Acidimicrobiales bacterium]
MIMVRIALLPSSYPPSLGGVEELTRHLARTLRAAGDEVEVWTLQSLAEPESAEIRDGIVVRRLPMPLPATNWPAIVRTVRTGTRTLLALNRAVAAFRPDVLHVQCFGPNGAYATALSRITGVPLVVTLQGETLMDDSDIFDTSLSLRWALRSGIRHAGAVTACSAWTLADAEARFGLAAGRGKVIPNGVELEADAVTGDAEPSGDVRAGAPGGQGAPVGFPSRPYVLALGRIVEKKGFDLLLAAYAAIDPDKQVADLVIAGQGEALERLRQSARSLGITDHVHFVGRLDRSAVASAMAHAELFVMPSRLEPFGIVVLEAWRASTAVVATTRGGASEFVRDGVDGMLVDPFDTARFAELLTMLLGDADRRRDLARSGHRRVGEFSWDRIAERYRAVHAAVVAKEAGAPSSEPPGNEPPSSGLPGSPVRRADLAGGQRAT